MYSENQNEHMKASFYGWYNFLKPPDVTMLFLLDVKSSIASCGFISSSLLTAVSEFHYSSHSSSVHYYTIICVCVLEWEKPWLSLAVIILLIMLLFCRFGRQGSLTVQQLDSEPMPSVKTTAPGSSTVMEVNKSTWVFVGGLGGQLKVDRVALT